MSQNRFLITPGALADQLGQESLSVVDASWYLPAQGRAARAEYEEAHIPGAVFFDQDAIVAPGSSLPHALPDSATFAEAVGRLGIRETDTIVVYDGMGLFSAPRVWWMFRAFGAQDVRVLDGGFPAWQSGAHPIESGIPQTETVPFAAQFDETKVADAALVERAILDGTPQILDVRSTDRFTGEAPEPREGVRSGHMPGAFNLPFSEFSEDGRLKPEDALRSSFRRSGVDIARPIVTSCGSGVTAAIPILALASLGEAEPRLYDGSWSEWGARPDTPVTTGGR